MLKISRIAAGLACIAAVSAAAMTPAVADTFPAKPVTLVVPFAPGGGTDILARTIAPDMAKALGQSIIVENRGGAGGNIGAMQVAKSTADGYTILFGSNTLAINASLYKSLPFDTLKDLSAIGVVATAPLVLVVNTETGITSVQDLIDRSRAKPGTLNWSAPGAGTPHHLAMAMFNQKTGADLTEIQYKGGGPAITDLVGNHTQASVLTLASVSSYIDAGRLRPLGVATTTRTSLMPDVPTIAEAGVSGYKADLWYGLFAPAGTPSGAIDKLNAALNQALESPELLDTLKKQGYETRAGTPQQLHELLVADVESSARTIADAKIPRLD